MRIYFIGIVVAFLGLLAAGQVQANELCGQRSGGVFTVERWKAMPDDDGKILYTVGLVSMDDKTITEVGGRVEFFSGSVRVAAVRLVLDKPVQPKARFELHLKQVEGDSEGGMIGDNDASITALACVSDIGYADGSGVIIN
jgi:hypothetical protein